jgi:hypothetical protein
MKKNADEGHRLRRRSLPLLEAPHKHAKEAQLSKAAMLDQHAHLLRALFIKAHTQPQEPTQSETSMTSMTATANINPDSYL